MNAGTKAAVALGAVSFGITLWMLRSGDAPERAPEPPPPTEAPAVPPTETAAPADFDAAVKAAERTGANPEGLRYQEEASPALSEVLQDRLAGCLGESSLGLAPFTIVVGVGLDGVVRATWASPETPLASCVLRRVTGAELPTPPIPDVWMAANIAPGQAEAEPEPEPEP